jgi:serine/threonine-protein kinase RsbW
MFMADVRHLIVRGRYENIPTITSFVGEAAEAAGFGESGVFHCQMAVDEACTNVIEHAYGGEDVGDIQITCTVEPGTCQVEVFDRGKPFIPEEIPEPSMQATIENLKPGGIGLHLMRQVMDTVEFSFTDAGNRLLMIKRGTPRSTVSTDDDIPSHEEGSGIWVLEPVGRMDSAAAPRLESALMDLIESGKYFLAVDLSEVSYISSRGLKALVKAWRSVQAENGDLVLFGLSGSVYEVFDTVGFTQVFLIFESRDEAIAALSQRTE